MGRGPFPPGFLGQEQRGSQDLKRRQSRFRTGVSLHGSAPKISGADISFSGTIASPGTAFPWCSRKSASCENRIERKPFRTALATHASNFPNLSLAPKTQIPFPAQPCQPCRRPSQPSKACTAARRAEAQEEAPSDAMLGPVPHREAARLVKDFLEFQGGWDAGRFRPASSARNSESRGKCHLLKRRQLQISEQAAPFCFIPSSSRSEHFTSRNAAARNWERRFGSPNLNSKLSLSEGKSLEFGFAPLERPRRGGRNPGSKPLEVRPPAGFLHGAPELHGNRLRAARRPGRPRHGQLAFWKLHFKSRIWELAPGRGVPCCGSGVPFRLSGNAAASAARRMRSQACLCRAARAEFRRRFRASRSLRDLR